MNRQGPEKTGATTWIDYRSTRCRCGTPIRPNEPICTICDRKQNLLVDGLDKIDTEDLDMTIGRLSRDIGRNPHDYVKMFRLANAYLLKGKYEPARDHYRRVLQVKSDFTSARLNLGVVLAYLGEEKAAIEELEQYVKQDIHSPKVEIALRAICSLRGVPYEDVLKETQSKQAGAKLTQRGEGVRTTGTYSGQRLRGTMYQPKVNQKKRAWGAIDIFLIFLIIVGFAGWLIFPVQSKELTRIAVAGLEAPFSFRVQNGVREDIPAPVDDEDESEDGTQVADADDEEEEDAEVDLSTLSYLPLANGNTWEYTYFDTRYPHSSGTRQNISNRTWIVNGLVRQDPDIWEMDITVDTILYVERSDGLYNVQDKDSPWSSAICQIPDPPTTGKEIDNGWQIVRVMGEEEVTTPAGTFTCIALRYTEPEPPDTEWFAWYAQGVGLVKYIGGGRLGSLFHVMELREFELN